jgi:hypothetical protein
MGRWVGGWVDGWVGGWMGGWMDGWMGRWVDRWLYSLMGGLGEVPTPISTAAGSPSCV